MTKDPTISANRTEPRPTNVLVVGVGGQGVIMVSKILAQLCQTQGFEVKQSEVHGMAKRGGVVFSHVRFGAKVWSPTIPRGESDILIALEWAEGLRWLEYLRPDRGVLIADTQQIVPPFACLNRKRGAAMGYSRETPAEVLGRVASGFALDAARMAAELGNPRVSNSVLLGVLSTALDFPVDDWRATLARFVPSKTVDVNLQAFEQGRAWAVAARESPPAAPSLPAPPPAIGLMHATGTRRSRCDDTSASVSAFASCQSPCNPRKDVIAARSIPNRSINRSASSPLVCGSGQ